MYHWSAAVSDTASQWRHARAQRISGQLADAAAAASGGGRHDWKYGVIIKNLTPSFDAYLLKEQLLQPNPIWSDGRFHLDPIRNDSL